MFKVNIAISYSGFTLQDFRNLVYSCVVILCISSKDPGTLALGVILIMAYPILWLNDRLKKRQGLDIETDFPTFRKWSGILNKFNLRLKKIIFRLP
ncbi:hypothetical protein A2954_06320 [Candidatus Roizmanbacteria bacterium RIFCSPLOWO2_01_FULL_37_12]|uniref:Uncharacterized protein n=1 Tax=Candidatus Roizmanbacteria bacterium RIFCSPLOWO2_01_FULL_37_12 TaxID=1802056 RepID=A0A1F7IAV3_9BACT|nr:MAG: hypothetical protein A2768_01660 [Candidatus Roizmanbacteria bacterium RIFCSPHIGHO2_01_FULL_37_16]OGK25770.1 MAG: hypothetical protein A3D76_02165 [Candidatus Roizmanbacteria bacterium RIFCSPHIGHO2_02_FULL_37_9b]OGK40472.1 MAG: hypothetical protein A2954_06320 [Candidatus Roizmanbacteria bacterium RIFCSPLOWO2_01_FULL_37_12]